MDECLKWRLGIGKVDKGSRRESSHFPAPAPALHHTSRWEDGRIDTLQGASLFGGRAVCWPGLTLVAAEKIFWEETFFSRFLGAVALFPPEAPEIKLLTIGGWGGLGVQSTMKTNSSQ